MIHNYICISAAALVLSFGAQAQEFTVSVKELEHPPSPKSFSAFQAARKLSDKGEHQKAAGQLQKAVELSPYYSDAWINLGAEHLYLKEFERALRELTRAREIARPNAVLLSDMAFAQYSLGLYSEGTQSAREALRLDSSYAPAHYLLGGYLVHDRATRGEGLHHLEVAARTMRAAQEELDRARADLP